MDKKPEIVNDFDYLLVLDFEATCDKNIRLNPQEIIEFPVVIVDVQNKKTFDTVFHYYIKPSENPNLTAFCTELTGIKQEQVDKGIYLAKAIEELELFLQEQKIFGKNYTFITCGDFDLANCLKKEAQYKKLIVPDFLKNYINIKKQYPKEYYPKGQERLPDMVAMLKGLSIKLEGHHHSGIDDSKNIARIVISLLEKGFKFNKNMRTFCNY